MFLGRVTGHVVATAKDPSIKGQKLLIVEPLKVAYDIDVNSSGRFEPTGRAIVSMDSLGAGQGQLVLIAQGSSARMAKGLSKIPVDAVVVGIVDEAIVMGHKIH